MAGIYRKTRKGAPQGFFECEGRGLQWLQQAREKGGPRVVDVYDWGTDYLDIERLATSSPTSKAAYRFGAELAHMHDCGATSFGAPPADYKGTCYFGPLQDPVPMDTGDWQDPVSYLSEGRLRPMVQMGIDRGSLKQSDMDMIEDVIHVLPKILGTAGHDKPARIHGDLWSGNVLWTDEGNESRQAVLIDPAAHGGHREEDLAMLHLFGMPYLSQIEDGYQSVHPLANGYRERYTLWQLYPIAGHCVFFGGGYVSELRSMCQELLREH